MMTCCYVFFILTALVVNGNGSADDDVPLTRLVGADAMAVCLDGSPAGYYYSAGSEEGVDNWIVYFMGGGWCPYIPSCQVRRGTDLGSTNNITTYHFAGMLSSNAIVNPDFHNWNRVLLHYCDGASFLGDTEDNSVPNSNLQFRGSRIFNAIVNELLLVKGMKNANNAILAGASAGGIATILHCDEFRAFLPNTSRVKCVSDAGFYIRGKDLPRPNMREGPFANLVNLHKLTNLLPTSCTSRFDPKLCFFPEYSVGGIKTPLFLLNSAFDNIQIQSSLKPNQSDISGWDDVCTSNANKCTPPQIQLITEFRNAFLDTIEETRSIPSLGIFITACFTHAYSDKNELWNSNESPRLMNMTVSQAVGDWYFDRRSSVQLIDSQTDFPLNCTVS